jgi:hypothetical protein
MAQPRSDPESVILSDPAPAGPAYASTRRTAAPLGAPVPTAVAGSPSPMRGWGPCASRRAVANSWVYSCSVCNIFGRSTILSLIPELIDAQYLLLGRSTILPRKAALSRCRILLGWGGTNRQSCCSCSLQALIYFCHNFCPAAAAAPLARRRGPLARFLVCVLIRYLFSVLSDCEKLTSGRNIYRLYPNPSIPV